MICQLPEYITRPLTTHGVLCGSIAASGLAKCKITRIASAIARWETMARLSLAVSNPKGSTSSPLGV